MNAHGWRSRALVLIVCSFLVTATGCKTRDGSDAAQVRSFHIKALVMEIEPARNRIVLAHEEIPHFMKAMTMGFIVRDSLLLKGIEVGDSVQGVLTVTASGRTLDSLIVVAKSSS